MRILSDTNQYRPFLRGSGIFFREMGERLAREGPEVSVYATGALHYDRFVIRKGPPGAGESP